jgi:two-component system alkaline phosphatase synthesis response regulator PhoP
VKILVVEDEPAIAMGLRDDLRLEGFDVEVAGDGLTAERRAREGGLDLTVLDIMLPGKDGLAVCRSLREAGIATPIVALTAKAQEMDRVLGLEFGADDYVTKPFSPRELVARIRAVLRRTGPAGEPAPSKLECGDLRMDFDRFEAWSGTRKLDLTATEFRILQTLVRERRRVVSSKQLLQAVWGKDIYVSERVIYTHINNLRAKLEADPAHPLLIVGIRRVGYRFDG